MESAEIYSNNSFGKVSVVSQTKGDKFMLS